MTETEAVALLKACKPLAERLVAIPPSMTAINIPFSSYDITVIEGYSKLMLDPIVAGPNLLNRLFKLAELNQVEVYKLNQMKKMIRSRRYGGLKATTNFVLGTGAKRS